MRLLHTTTSTLLLSVFATHWSAALTESSEPPSVKQFGSVYVAKDEGGGAPDFAAKSGYKERQELPLLREEHFVYLGAFRVPRGKFGNSRFGYGGRALAFRANQPDDPRDDTLFIDGHIYSVGSVAEITIPTPVISDDLGDLPTAQVRQGFADITDGLTSQIRTRQNERIVLGGLLVVGDRLIWSAYRYYDAGFKASRSHGSSSLELEREGDARGMFRVGSLNPGVVAGYMALVPTEWQEAFDVPVLTGQSNLPIITRTSAGPTAVGFDPGSFGEHQRIRAVPFLYYSVKKPLGSGLRTKNPMFNFNSSVGGLLFPAGTRSLVFFGGHGTGEWCYGTSEECNDPFQRGKGNHDVGGNYVYQVWAYDALEVVAARNGRLSPWKVKPYATWRPTFPFPMGDKRIGGVAYDKATNRVFVVQDQADRSERYVEPHPLLHVFQIRLASATNDKRNVEAEIYVRPGIEATSSLKRPESRMNLLQSAL